MISTRIVAMTALIVLCLTTHINAAQKAKYEGEFWNKTDRVTKEVIIGAVFWGQEAGYDKVYVETILGKEKSDLQTDCIIAVGRSLKSLQAKKDSIDTTLVIQNMDKFYSIPNNKSLRLKWAFMEAMLRIQGTSEEEIKAFVEEIKRSHSN